MYLRKGCVFYGVVFLSLALIVTATAGDISGTWVAPALNHNVTMVFKVNGTILTGTVKTRPSDEAEIRDGKIQGKKISFYIERTIHQKKVRIWFKGTLAGEEIYLTRTENGSVKDMIARRTQSRSSITL